MQVLILTIWAVEQVHSRRTFGSIQNVLKPQGSGYVCQQSRCVSHASDQNRIVICGVMISAMGAIVFNWWYIRNRQITSRRITSFCSLRFVVIDVNVSCASESMHTNMWTCCTCGIRVQCFNSRSGHYVSNELSAVPYSCGSSVHVSTAAETACLPCYVNYAPTRMNSAVSHCVKAASLDTNPVMLAHQTLSALDPSTPFMH